MWSLDLASQCNFQVLLVIIAIIVFSSSFNCFTNYMLVNLCLYNCTFEFMNSNLLYSCAINMSVVYFSYEIIVSIIYILYRHVNKCSCIMYLHMLTL